MTCEEIRHLIANSNALTASDYVVGTVIGHLMACPHCEEWLIGETALLPNLPEAIAQKAEAKVDAFIDRHSHQGGANDDIPF